MSKSLGYAAFVGLLAAACSGGDPGALKFTVPWDAEATGIHVSPVKEAGAPVATLDSGPAAAVDAGVSAPPSPFADSYQSVEIRDDNTAIKKHIAANKPSISDAAKATQCMTCHQSGNGVTDTQMKNFLFAGYASSDIEGNAPLSNAEVWVVDSTGKRVKTNTDSDGHFWLLKGSQSLTPPLYTGIRTSSKQVVMKSSLGGLDTDCNKCHDKTTAAGGFITISGI